jgi:hypothetical protein
LAAGVEGGKMERYPTKDDNLYVFSRTVDGSSVLVLLNLGAEAAKVEYTGKKPEIKDNTINYFTEKAEALPTELAAGEYRVYVNR